MTKNGVLDELLEYWQQDQSNIALIVEILDLHIKTKQFLEGLNFIAGLDDDIKHLAIPRFKQAQMLIGLLEFEQAQTLLEALNLDNPTQVHIAYNLAYIHFVKGEFAKVKDILSTVVEQWQQCPEVLILLARCLRVLGEPAVAINLVKSYLVDIDNKDSEALSLLSLLYTDVGHFEAAIALAEKQLEQNPELIEAISALGTSLIITKDYPKAEKWLNHGVEVYPKALGLWREKGSLELVQLKIPAAHASFSQALAIRHNDSTSLFLKALCELLQKQFVSARELFEGVLQLEPHHGESYAGIAICDIVKDDKLQAEHQISLSLSKNPSNHLGLLASGLWQTRFGDSQEGEKVLEILLSSREVSDAMPYLNDFYRNLKSELNVATH